MRQNFILFGIPFLFFLNASSQHISPHNGKYVIYIYGQVVFESEPKILPNSFDYCDEFLTIVMNSLMNFTSFIQFI